MEWQPIETAPKDGSRILLFLPMEGKGWNPVFGNWYEDKYAKNPRPYWTNDHERVLGVKITRERQPTHWMPLPEPPK